MYNSIAYPVKYVAIKYETPQIEDVLFFQNGIPQITGTFCVRGLISEQSVKIHNAKQYNAKESICLLHFSKHHCRLWY